GDAWVVPRLNSAGIDSVLIYLTATGLKKSILDATEPLRALLTESNFHHFHGQEPGGAKIRREVTLFCQEEPILLESSFYRPATKKGDPRFWPSRLHKFVNEGDVLAAFVIEDRLYFSNLSEEKRVILEPCASSAYETLLDGVGQFHNATAQELLSKLRDLAKAGPILADGYGDTSIGRTLESALGIKMNASVAPDYKGIELKSKRLGSKTRNGLFNQVPNWKLSRCKSSAEILKAYGYLDAESGLQRLYCTVSTRGTNPQGLVLDLRDDVGELHELFRRGGSEREVCLWEVDKLHGRLQSKHPETFWVEAEEIATKGKRYFQLLSVKHTRRPSNRQFSRLLSIGSITVDHQIKEKGNGAAERGPAFKISRSELNELFLGATQSYGLL
ncbi:MAG: MvaI/BcnI family restriction endonuclease, partial [Verrucomicrobiota bacterium]